MNTPLPALSTSQHHQRFFPSVFACDAHICSLESYLATRLATPKESLIIADANYLGLLATPHCPSMWGLQDKRPPGHKATSSLGAAWLSRQLFYSSEFEFGQTGNSAIRSADPENPTLESNMKWIGWPLAEIWPFEIFPNERSVGRSYSLHWSHILLFVTLGTQRARSKR